MPSNREPTDADGPISLGGPSTAHLRLPALSTYGLPVTGR